ncbi:MAG TPA: DoxX family protein [Isosphaeraceae bacterium]|nr:DoxX family protein [Isosphaeraceae bacterium]
MLLRTGIGWHFLYEGVEKIYSTPAGRSSFLARVLPPPPQPPPMEKPAPTFSAESYLRNASGPLAPYFRSLVPDLDSRSKLRYDQLKLSWERELDRYTDHYRFTQAQRDDAEKALHTREAAAEDWFRDSENKQKVDKYFDDLKKVLAVERNPDALASERTQAAKDRTQIEADRKQLVATVDGWTEALRDSWEKLASPEQAKASGVPSAPWTQLDWINTLTMFGLTAVGVCLLLGLMTRLAALGGATFLLMFYLSMPPWPGLPAAPMAEGHYLFVNKNLIEMLACLLLAATPNGHWVGLDALLFGWMGRRRSEPAEAPSLFDSGPAPASTAHR